MNVSKSELAALFGVSTRTITTWQSQGMPIAVSNENGGRDGGNRYCPRDVIGWYARREADLENEVLRKELDGLKALAETDLQPGSIDYERYRLTRAQADGQELKNAKESAEVVEAAFCTFVLSRIAGEISSLLDTIPLAYQRRYPGQDARHAEFLRREIAKAMNKAADLGESLPDLLNEYISTST